MLLSRSLLFAASLSFLSFTSAYIVTTQKFEPDALLVPGKTLFYNVVVEAKDTVVLVDIILANGILGNTSDIFGNSDLRKTDDSNAGFTVPLVPPGKQYTVRLVDTSTKKFLADSPQFEIFALNGVTSSGASSLPATTLPPISKTASNSSPSGSSTVNTSLTPSTSGTAPVKAAEKPKSKTPVGAIAGGVVGGLVVIGLIIFFLLSRRRRGTPTTKGTDSEKAYALTPPGPHAVEPYTLPPSAVRPGAGLDSTASLTGTDPRSTDAGPLPSKMGYGFAATASSLNAGSSTRGESILGPGTRPTPTPLAAASSTDPTRVEQLRLERERINRELAALEQRPGPGSTTTGSSAYGASSYVPPSTAGSLSNQESLAEQLLVLQTQIRQLEERQQRRESDLPPMYDGPPVPPGVATVSDAPPPSQYPGMPGSME